MKNIFAAVCLMLLLVSPVFAEEKTIPTTNGLDAVMMERIKAATEPNENHKVLELFVGKWKYIGNFYMAPDAPPQQMTGITENTMIYGGRFLKQTVNGPAWSGEPFEGLSYTGYDNIKKAYVTVWLDSMGTGLVTTSGNYDAAAKTLKQEGKNSCPMTGETDRKGRSEWKIVDNDHSVYTNYAFGPDGKEFKAMEITYERAK